MALAELLTNRRTKFVKLDGPHSAEAGQCVGAAGFATFGPRLALVAGRICKCMQGSSTRHELSSEIQYWNSVFLILLVVVVVVGVRTRMMPI